MKPSIKLATMFAVVASLGSPSAFAQKSDDWGLNKPTKSATFGFGASGSLDYGSSSFSTSVDDIQDFDDLGEKVRVRDGSVTMDATLGGIAGARVTLEENSNDASIDAKNLESKARDAYIGLQPMNNLVLIYGRTDVPHGGDVTRRAINRNDINHRLHEQNERKLIAAVTVTSAVMQQLMIQSVEIAKFSSLSDPTNVKFNDKLDSYSARVTTAAMKINRIIDSVVAQASYMKIDNKETRTSISAETGLVLPKVNEIAFYGEFQAIRQSALNGDVNVLTLGAEKALTEKTSVYGEVSSAKETKGEKKSQNGLAVGVKHKLNQYVTLGLEGSNQALAAQGVGLNKKEKTVMATAEFKAKQPARSAFGWAKPSAKDADGSKARDEAAKLRAR